MYSTGHYSVTDKKVIKSLKPLPKDIENYHIDHIVPLTMWDLNNPEHVRKAHLPHNLQWLDKTENIKKGNRLVTPQK